MALATWDMVALVSYFAIVMVIGLVVGASIFASNIGSEHFIGLAGSGAAAGIAVGAFEISALTTVQILGWLMLPVYISSKVTTMPEYMNKRFGGHRIRVFLAVLSLLLYVLAKISVNLLSGSIFIQQALGTNNVYLGVFIILAVTVVCTLTGGLASVIYIETFQTALMVFGAGGLSAYALAHVGGFSGLKERYMSAVPLSPIMSSNFSSEVFPGNFSQDFLWQNSSAATDHCHVPNPNAFQMLRSNNDFDLPTLGFFIGGFPSFIWYWAADQMIVQRALSSKSISHAQGGTTFAAYLKLLPLFIAVLPGMISRVLYKDEVACNTPESCLKACGSETACFSIAYPKLIMELAPAGFRGIMLAAMLAALMSGFMSIFNSAATLTSIDIWSVIRRKSSDHEKLIVGRVWVIIMVVLSILWIPVLENAQGGQIFIYLNSVQGHLASPVAAIYLAAILWKRCNEKGAFWGLTIGCLIGALRLCLVFYYGEPLCGQPDTRPFLISGVHYFYFSAFLFWVTVLVCVAVSLLSTPAEEHYTIRTTYWTRFDRRPRPDEIIGQSEHDAENCAEMEFVERIRVQRSDSEDEKANDNYSNDNFKTTLTNLFSRICFGSQQSSQMEIQEQKRLDFITSLQQTKFEKLILNSNLLITQALVIVIFVYFSI